MPSSSLLLSPLLLLPAISHAMTLDCSNIQADDQAFDISKLGGPKDVHLQHWEPPNILNTTFTIDLCNTLKPPKGAEKGTECPHGTRICAKEEAYRNDAEPFLERVIPIAGEYTTTDRRSLDAKFTRLKNGESSADSEREGLRIELHGGRYDKVDQMAYVEIVCDHKLEGNEGFEDNAALLGTNKYEAMRRRDDGNDEGGEDDEAPELPDLDKGKALQALSYKKEEHNMVLRLEWKSKYGCEGVDGDKGSEGGKSGGWGFFTWFLIIVFLLAASYIIFGSWLNYNRYGARGWDLIPHGDTIRDIPYIVKDWGNSLVEKMRGGSRGGYSAV